MARSSIKLIVYALGIAFWLAIAFDLGRQSKSVSTASPEAQSLDCSSSNWTEWGICSVSIAPRAITLRFVSRKTYDELSYDALENHNQYTTLAFTYARRNPCEIVVPAEGKISIMPRTARAFWDSRSAADDDLGNTLVHEIAHCFAGAWHPDNYGLVYFNRQFWTPPIARPRQVELDFALKIPSLRAQPWEMAPHNFVSVGGTDASWAKRLASKG